MSYIPKNWNDLPIEDTPITADDLDHIENGIKEISNVNEYLNGILELNADTYVNISNQLISGMIIHIKFPTISSTANATLSLDNGTTKKSIKCSGVDVIGTDVSGKNLDLSYDGTYWQIGDVCSLDTRLTTAEEDINNAEAVIGNEADTYSASSTYALGSLVIYNSLLYKCTTAITVAEAWNSAKWTQIDLVNVSSGLKGKILWTNPNPYSLFAGQTITLDESMENYDGYCIIYNGYLNDGFSFNTGIIPKGKNTILIYTANIIWTRNITIVNNTTVTFGNCIKYSTYGSTGTNDNYLLLPHYIIGYKTGLFS